MDTEKKKELWERLENEPERAFDSYRSLPRGERTMIEAYRQHVGNPEAVKPSDTWTRWSSEFAWRERAAAYDDHLESMRREAYERGIEEEAERQGALAERNRNRMNEMLTLSYERAAEWFENAQPSDLRAQDVLGIIRVHMDAVKAFGVEEPRVEDDWTEEDDAEFGEIVKEIDELEDPDKDSDEDEGPAQSSDGESRP